MAGASPKPDPLAPSRPLQAPAKVQTARRQQVVVCAVQQQQEAVPRRAALALAAAALFGLGATAAEAAQPAPKNSYVATAETYNMEGIKKQVGGALGGMDALRLAAYLGVRACRLPSPRSSPDPPSLPAPPQGVTPKRKRAILDKLKKQAGKK